MRWVLAAAFALCASPALAQSANDLVRSALKSRDAVKSAQALLASARATASSQGAYPATRIEAGTPTPVEVQGGEDLTLFQPLDIFGKSQAAGASGRAAVKVAEANLRQAELGVQTDVIAAAAAWSNAARELSFAQEQLGLAQALDTATKKRVAATALPEIQAIRSGFEVQKAQQLVIDRQAAVQSALVKLKQAVGDPGLNPAVASVNLERDLIKAPDPDRGRPELLTAIYEREGFLADERAARLSQLPDFEIQARRSPWSTPEQYGVKLALVLPLWDHGAARQKAFAASLQAKASALELADTEKKVKAEMEAARIQLDAAEKSFAAYTKLADGARELLRKTQRGFELGASTLLDVLDARRAVSDALEQLSNSRQSLDLAVGEVLRAQGQLLGEGQ